MQALQSTLDHRKANHLYRQRRLLQGPQQAEVVVDGRPLLNFCSNDYLGLANHPRVVAAAREGVTRYGAGSGASHLVCGHSLAHQRLEEALAAFVQRPRALLFSSGYMANQGVITALMGRGDRIFEDRLNHASLIDGARLSGARLQRYPHNAIDVLQHQLQGAETGRRLVAVDGVFSMDGDAAPLPELAQLCTRHDAWLMVDDAHGFGLLGEGGGGSLEAFGLGVSEVPILMATLGKALGSFGAFVAGDDTLIETLIQQARSYIYTTALPPASAEAARAALKVIQEEEWRRQQLWQRVAQFRSEAARLGLPLLPSTTPIQPLLAKTPERAMAWSAQLEAAGILVGAIRPPTVPEGSARLRITLSAGHTESHLEQLLAALAQLPLDEKRP